MASEVFNSVSSKVTIDNQDTSEPLVLYHIESPPQEEFVLYHIESPGL